MAIASNRRAEYGRPLNELVFSPWILVPLSILLGAFIAFQFFHVTARYVKLVFAIAVLITLARASFSASMTVFLVLWVAPTSIYLGDTNVIFIGTMTVIWLIRMRIGAIPRPVRTPIDWIAWVYLAAHFISLLNVSESRVMSGSLENLKFITAGVVFYFLIVNAFRTEAHLRGALMALVIVAVIADVTAIADHYFGIRLIPEWFLFAPAALMEVEAWGRAQGVFGFHGLLADFSAMSFYLVLMLAMRTRSRAAKAFYWLLAALAVHMIGITANRGGAIIWVVGGLYFVWLMRRRVRWALAGIFVPLAAAVVGFFSLLSDRFLYRIRVLSRLATTQITRGVPENRVDIWAMYRELIPNHLWIGHGPYIDLGHGTTYQLRWPHNAYIFYAYTTGLLGLGAWLWILAKMVWTTRPGWRVDFARDPLPAATRALFHIMIVMFALSQWRDEHQRGNVFFYLMWILFGLGTVAARLSRGAGAGRPAEERLEPAVAGAGPHANGPGPYAVTPPRQGGA